ncbi:MAG: hypothetical protein AAF957_23185 [Planctomycetota bacterium]
MIPAIRSLALAPLALLAAATAAAQSLPERPAIHREVTSVLDVGGPQESDHDPRFQVPHVPPFRTTQDGRLAITVEGAPRFTVLTPEKLQGPGGGPLLLQPPGADAMSWAGCAILGGDHATQAAILTADSGREIVHSCLWDDDLPSRTSGGRDLYRIKVIVSTRGQGGSVRLFMTPLRVEVARPKTRWAHVASLEVDGPTVAGPDFANNGAASFHSVGGFEPTVAGDGRLLVFRVAAGDVPTPSGPRGIDIVYCYYEDPAGTRGTANPAYWTEVLPIAHAHHDARLARPLEQGGFGFAQHPLRDTAGTIVPDWEDLGGSYPWIDRDAKTLFFTTIADTLHFQDANAQSPNRDPNSASEWTNARYETALLPGDPRCRFGAESNERFRGVAFAGLWTHGKTVLADGLLNDMDYSVGNSKASSYGGIPYNVGPQQRLVRLFEGSAAPSLDPASGWVRLGYGRATRSAGLPAGDNGNNSIIDSTESQLHLSRGAVPLLLRDVVWHVQNGKHVDEVAFDDHVDPGALVLVDMTGHLSLTGVSGTGFNALRHHSGWNDAARAFGAPVRLQNGATETDRWALPPFASVVDHGAARGRLEPAALGGVHGRGLWLEDGIALEVPAPARAGAATPEPDAFYAGVFVDLRFDDDGETRRLLAFPDGTSIELLGRSALRYLDGDRVVHRVQVPGDVTFVPDGGGAPRVHPFFGRGAWTHVGLRIQDGGRRVTLLVDGFPLDRWQDPARTLFQPLAPTPGAGAIVLGGPTPGSSVTPRGWVDELKVFAHDVDPELAANHARGTLIGFPNAPGSNAWKDRVAAAFPARAHREISEELRRRGEPTFGRYAAFVDPTRDRGVHRESLPDGATHLRAAMHFPEGPVFWDRPRPDSTTNAFCLTCHHPAGLGGLDVDALAYTGVPAIGDPRRQPSQPPAYVSGVLPVGFVDAGSEPRPRADDPRPRDGRPVPVDRWLQKTFRGRAARAETLTLVDADTGRDLGPLTPGAALDVAVLGTDRVDVRVDLDVGQGAVTLVLRRLVPNPVEVHRRTAPHGPYRLFGAGAGSFALQAGSYEIEVEPAGGTALRRTFDVTPTGPRRITGYRDAFVDGSPADGSYMRWNDVGAPLDPSEFVSIGWDRSSDAYAVEGGSMSGPLLGPLGGRPGRGTLQVPAGEHERVAAVGYRARARGHYLVEGLGDAVVGGGSIVCHALRWSAATGAVTTLFEEALPGAGPTITGPPALLDVGDVLWVVVAPGDDDVGDDFTWDFGVRYGEAIWAQDFD